MGLDAVVQKVVDKIQTDVNLGTTDLKDVKKIYFGKLRELPINYPCVAVFLQDEGENPGSTKADSTRILYRIIIGITVFEKYIDDDSGEKEAMKKLARIEIVLRSDKTLGGTVADEPVPAMSKTPEAFVTDELAITALTMFVTYRRWENY